MIGPAELTAEVMRRTFETNVFGMVRSGTATDLNRSTGHQTVEEGAKIVVRMAQLSR